MEITLKLDQWDIQSELTFEVDREKFTDEKAKHVNEFWTGAATRRRQDGDDFRAAIKLYAQACFRLIAFNNFKDEDYVMRQINEDEEGFYPFDEIGLKLKSIDNWSIEYDHVSFD